jgi:hypothetical protein
MLLGLSLVVVSLGIHVSPGYSGPKEQEKKEVKVCHRPPGNPSNVQIKTLDSQSAIDAHLAHGDTFVETFYQDADGDGFGTQLSTIIACEAPKGFVANNTDCDDTRAAVYPGAVEIPGNGIDDDCSPETLDATCPCEGDVLGNSVWAPGQKVLGCGRFTNGSAVIEFGERFPEGEVLTGRLLLRIEGECFVDDRFTLEDPTHRPVTPAQFDACLASLRSIASAAGINGCP